MASHEVVELPVYPTSSEEFRRLARPVILPEPGAGPGLTFTPAFDGFTIGTGRLVDISHLYIPPLPDPLGVELHRPLMDRHLDSEEVWVVLRGDLVMGMAESEEDPLGIPSVKDFRLFYIRQGETFVLPAARWHGGIWGAAPNTPAEFLMFLSGHRSDQSGRRVDHVMESYPEDVAIVPSKNLPK